MNDLEAANSPQPHKKGNPEVTFDIPDIGTGRYLNTSTRILTDLLVENTLYEKMGVLVSVMEHLGITIDDLKKHERNQKRWTKLNYDEDEKYSWEESEQGK